ncbi:hypothetical protein TNCV_2137921 [Trichonephila clavipes]|nr:hypothetical protein TNCV_2137921 [Trichonephila clavipes]
MTGLPLAPCQDTFRGPRSDYVRQIGIDDPEREVPVSEILRNHMRLNQGMEIEVCGRSEHLSSSTLLLSSLKHRCYSKSCVRDNVTLLHKCFNILTATARSDVVQSGRPIFDDFFQHLRPYIANNTANVVFQMIKRLWLIRIDQ